MRAVLVPGVLALLPEYAGLHDPVPDLRLACREAVAWLGSDVTVLGDAQGRRVADHLLASTSRVGDGPSYLVVGNGSARRSEKAPGHLDERSFGFDEALGAALRSGRLDADLSLAEDLWAGVEGIAALSGHAPLGEAVTDYAGDPFGVQYWVMRWETPAT